jgi:hypothetical protein
LNDDGDDKTELYDEEGRPKSIQEKEKSVMIKMRIKTREK